MVSGSSAKNRKGKHVSRRRSVRVLPEKSAPIRVDLMGSNFIDILTSRDISTTGVSIYVPHDFENCDLEHEVEMLLKLPAPFSHHFSTNAKILHTQGHFFGVEFQYLKSYDFEKLHAYIAFRIQERDWRIRWSHTLQYLFKLKKLP